MNCIRLTVADNGFVLSYDDPEIRDSNRGDGPWKDPERQRVYETPEALVADLGKLLPLLKPEEPPTETESYRDALSEVFSKGIS